MQRRLAGEPLSVEIRVKRCESEAAERPEQTNLAIPRRACRCAASGGVYLPDG